MLHTYYRFVTYAARRSGVWSADLVGVWCMVRDRSCRPVRGRSAFDFRVPGLIFRDFSKKLFRVLNRCFRLFSAFLRTSFARAITTSLKKGRSARCKNIFQKSIDNGYMPAYNGYCQQGIHPRQPAPYGGRDSPSCGRVVLLTERVP